MFRLIPRRPSALALVLLLNLGLAPAAEPNPRIFVLTDIGNEPDDAQSLVRLLLYSDKLDIEGIVGTTSRFLVNSTQTKSPAGSTQEREFNKIIDAYGRIRANLLLHATGFPTVESLRSVVSYGPNGTVGNIAPGATGSTEQFGMRAVDKDNGTLLSDGAKLLINAVDREDSRPLWVSIWGGPNTLAQALSHVKATRSAAQMDAFIRKLRVYAIEDQESWNASNNNGQGQKDIGTLPEDPNNSGVWIRKTFPQLHYMFGTATTTFNPYIPNSFRGMFELLDPAGYPNSWDTTTYWNTWIINNVWTKERKLPGTPADVYPWCDHGLEGDSPAFLYLLGYGLSDPEHPEWGSWGGRFVRESGGVFRDAEETISMRTRAGQIVQNKSKEASVYRWRESFNNDFINRLDWCVKPAGQVNRPPIAVVADGLVRTEVSGAKVMLSAAASSDPDGNALSYRWFYYPEASTYDGAIEIANATSKEASFTAPTVAQNCTLHVILEVTDNGTPQLTRYQRVRVTVTPPIVTDPSAGPLSVNLGGSQVTIDGRSWISTEDAVTHGLVFTSPVQVARTQVTPIPADASLSPMLNTAVWSSTGNLGLSQEVANGTYEVSLWVMENWGPLSGVRRFDLELEGIPTANGLGTLAYGAWKKYGPYPAAVRDGRLDLTLVKQVGDPHLMGLEIRPTTPTSVGIPAPWKNGDLGGPAKPGSANLANGTWTVTGGGADIWNTRDAFNFLSQPCLGDAQITALVTSQQDTDWWAKAGLMIRETAAPDSRHVLIAVTPGNGVTFQYRQASGGQCAFSRAWLPTTPAWIRLTRVGNLFTAAHSIDGKNWNTVGSTSVAMSAAANIGLAVTSHNDAVTSTAIFEQVSVVSATPGNG